MCSIASSVNFLYLLFSLRPSSSCLLFLRFILSPLSSLPQRVLTFDCRQLYNNCKLNKSNRFSNMIPVTISKYFTFLHTDNSSTVSDTVHYTARCFNQNFTFGILIYVQTNSIISDKSTEGRRFNLLKPTGYLMHQQFNIQQLYVLPTRYLCVLYLSENKQRLVPLTA